MLIDHCQKSLEAIPGLRVFLQKKTDANAGLMQGANLVRDSPKVHEGFFVLANGLELSNVIPYRVE